MRSVRRSILVTAMVGALIASVISAVGAQQAEVGYVAAVNGASTDPVSVAVGGTQLADNLEYAADGVGATVPTGTRDVSFTGGSIDSSTSINITASSAQTVVSGFGEGDGSLDTAFSYPIDVSPIDEGMAKVTFWNATGATVLVTMDTDDPVEVRPGEGLATMVVPADTTIAIDVDGVTRDIAPQADSYFDVFAVNDIQEAQIAISVIASMTDLIASMEPGGVAVPDVRGLTATHATSAITGAGLVTAITEAPDDTVPVGIVISQDPAAGSTVAEGSTVAIVVSTGLDEPATVPVPDVVGQSASDAQAALESEGFVVTTTEQPSADVEAGLVISTSPAAGTEVAPGTSVEMTVSSGPEDVVVPDFIGMGTNEATETADAAGLTIWFVEDANNPDPNGVVISQSPTAGTTVSGGSEVVAQLNPDLGEPWSIVILDQNRLMTVTGVGLLPGSTVNLSIIGKNIRESVAVQDNGSWTARFDLSDVDNDAELLRVEGTASDTSSYEAVFQIPAAGSSTDTPSETVEEDSGFPLWGWVLIGLVVAAIVLLVIRMRSDDSDEEIPEKS